MKQTCYLKGMKKSRRLYLYIVLVCSLNSKVIRAYSNGGIPLSRCQDMTPQHGVTPQPTFTNPYTIKVPFETYLPNRTIPITLKAQNDAQQLPFRGYYIQGRTSIGEQPIGSFAVANSSAAHVSRTHSCPSNSQEGSISENTLSHNSQWSSNAEARLKVDWKAPFSNSDIYFNCTFVQSFNTLWINASSTILSPMHQFNFIECCQRESNILSDVKSLCQQVSNEGFSLSTRNMFEAILADEDQSRGLFLALRCLHWSTSSSTSARNRRKDCCLDADVSDQCSLFCDGETYATWEGFAPFSQQFYNCSQENDALVSCQLHVDECATNPCHPQAECFNGEGYFTCQCLSGYTGNGTICSDIDECEIGICSWNSLCKNSPGSFKCECLLGYSGDGVHCTDINECLLEICSWNSSCTNSPGSFECECLSGYSGDEFDCTDIDECTMNPCSPWAECFNEDGNFTCECLPGYTGDGIDCSDINECLLGICSWNSSCRNSMGSFECECLSGYSGDEFGCTDIDECASNPCPPWAECFNEEGNFTCQCLPGYTGDGTICLEEMATLLAYPENVVVYTLITAIDEFTATTSKMQIIESLETNLIIPAMATLSSNYLSIRRLYDQKGPNNSFIVATDALFTAADLIPFEILSFPLIQDVKYSLESRAMMISYSLPVNGQTSRVSFQPEIEVNHKMFSDIDRSCSFTVLPDVPENFNVLCVGVNVSIFICLFENGTEILCEDIPESQTTQLQENTLLYQIISTIEFTPSTNRQMNILNDALENEILVPAMETFEGFQMVRYVSFEIGSLIVTSEAQFLAGNTSNGIELPTLSAIEASLKARTSALNNTLTVPILRVNETGIDPNFVVSHAATNGLCGNGTACPTPPTDYSSSCVEVGPSSVVCLCVSADDNTEVDCDTIGIGANGELISPGAIAGIVIGGFAGILILIIIIFCLCKRNRNKTVTKAPTYEGYVDPETIKTKTTPKVIDESLYMEISPKESTFYTVDGEYLIMSAEGVENPKDKDGNPLKQELKSSDSYNGYETPLTHPPILPGNHPKAITNPYVKMHTGKKNSSDGNKSKHSPVLTEGNDGYLISINPDIKELETIDGYEVVNTEDRITPANTYEETNYQIVASSANTSKEVPDALEISNPDIAETAIDLNTSKESAETQPASNGTTDDVSTKGIADIPNDPQ